MNSAATTEPTLQQKYEAAAAAIRDGEARNLSARTMAKKYRALFAVEDQIKGKAAWS